MLKITIPILAILLAAAIAMGHTSTHNTEDLIEWTESYKLCWDDFQGKADPKSFGDAGTAIYIKAKPYYERKKIVYEVNAFFVKNKSWYKEKSDALLAHEQLHFDIAELYARKARQKISELKSQGINDFKVYNTAVQRILDESNDADRKYDQETLHGMLSEKQAEWQKKVEEDLVKAKV